MITTLLLTSMFACGDKNEDTAIDDTGADTEETDTEETDTEETDTEIPDAEEVYAFENRDGESSVSYSGQVFRHILINDVKVYVGEGLPARLGVSVVTPGAVTSDLDFYYNTIKDVDVTSTPHYANPNSDIAVKQANYGDISSGKNIFGKFAN